MLCYQVWNICTTFSKHQSTTLMSFLKPAIFLGLFLALTNIAVSQSYSVTPNDTSEMTGMKEDLQSLMISQLNTSSDTIRLKWKKVSEVVPANWDATICDNAICYGSLVDSGQMTKTAPGATSFLLLHVTAHVNYGTAIVRYAVWDVTTPAQRDTLTFIVNVTATAGIADASDISTVMLYPNPVNNTLQITSNLQTGFAYIVTDLSGREVQRGNALSSSFSLSTANFPQGSYLVTLSDNNTICTHKIIKE